MRRFPIRDVRSRSKIKPRVFDLILNDDGKMEIEIKGKDGTKTIPLEDIRIQIKEIEMKIQPITEPRIRFKLPRYQIAGVVITPVKDVMMTPAFYFQGVVFFAKEQWEEFGGQNRQIKKVVMVTNQETMGSGKTFE